ncbi:hypothetical protein [Amycolatopsis sp. lyj-346]|uniref:hypothetical protein n=1 Tax=Amycolatopsis sp. lyj-346 TaxID=2789289 RepID=UPI00397C3562
MTRSPEWLPPGSGIAMPGCAWSRGFVRGGAAEEAVIKEIRSPDPVRAGVSALSAGFDIVEPGLAGRAEPARRNRPRDLMRISPCR